MSNINTKSNNKRTISTQKAYSVENRSELTAEELLNEIRKKIQKILNK